MIGQKKYALVTGSTRGIGKQIAVEFLKRGCFVILNYFSSDVDAKKTAEEFSKISSDFVLVKADLSTYKGLNILVKKTKSLCEKLDYLVLNAGCTSRKSFNDLSVDDWDKVMNTNLNIPVFLVKNLSGIMRDRGSVLFIGSILGIHPHSVSIPYGVSKAALHMFAKYLVKVFADRKITVNVIAPGFVDTSWHKNKLDSDKRKIEQKIALGRFADVGEIAMACMNVIDNAYINGQVIVVDGGYDYF